MGDIPLNKNSFEVLYKESAGFVYNVALRISANTFVAEEATQEVFIKAFRNASSFEARADIKTWLYRIAVNTTLDITRKQRRESGRRVSYDEDIVEKAGGSDDVEKTMTAVAARATVQKLLDTLPEEQKVCIILRELEGLSYEEIARTLEVNINTVRTRIKRARTRLLEAAKQQEGGESDGLQ